MSKNITGIDKYAWLEKDSPKTEEWVDFEHNQTVKYLRNTKNREKLRRDLKKLFRTDTMLCPTIRGNMHFFRYRKSNEDQFSIYVKVGEKGKSELLLSFLTLRKLGGTLSSWSVSENGKFIALQLSASSNDKNVIKIFDVQKRKVLKDVVDSSLYPYFSAWNRDSLGFWYVKGVNTSPGNEKYYKKIFYHQLGDNVGNDKIFFGDNIAKTDWPIISSSLNGNHIVINVRHENDTTSCYYRNAKDLNSPFIKIFKGIIGDSHAIPINQKIYFITDHEAPNKKILSLDYGDAHKNSWKIEVKEQKNKIDGLGFTKNYILINYLNNITSNLVAHNLITKKDAKIDIPSLGSISSIITRLDYKDSYLTFSSFNSPHVIYKLSNSTLKLSTYWRAESAANYKDIEVKQEWVASNDGTKIPMFVVHKKDVVRNKNTPTLVYAYGGFATSITPSFIETIYPFLNAGGVYVSVNIRGGDEFGKKWHESAIKNKRHKAFEDFSSVLRSLSHSKKTSREKICIWGASNGGLLMSVMMTRYPDLFKCAVIQVPVTDMLKFHLFNGGRWWINDYGDPDNKKMREYLESYSPYHNVKDFNYPTAFFVTARQDDRVHPMHSFKMVAKLKSNKKQVNPILLRAEKKAGHSGGGKISSFIERYADIFAFVFKELGI